MKKMLSALLSTVLLLSLFGCGAAMNSGASADTQTNGFAFSDQNKYESSMGFDSAAPMEPESAAPGYNAVETPSSSLPDNVKMIYRGYLYLESTAFDEAVEGLNQLVAKMGGYFESSELNNYSPYRSACYVVRVPSAKYNEFCGQVGGLAQLNSQRHTTENVSEAYYDTESRLLTQRTKLERLQELLAKAENMEDIITLESAIADTELNIEYLTGTLRKYDALVDYALRAAAGLTEGILAGKTDVSPVRVASSFDACQYCEYLNACQFDERAGSSARRTESLSAREAMQRMRDARGDLPRTD